MKRAYDVTVGALAMLKRGNIEEAEDVFLKQLNRGEACYLTHYGLGTVELKRLLRSGSLTEKGLQKVAKCYERAIELNPYHEDSHYVLGLVRRKIGQSAKACGDDCTAIVNFTGAKKHLQMVPVINYTDVPLELDQNSKTLTVSYDKFLKRFKIRSTSEN